MHALKTDQNELKSLRSQLNTSIDESTNSKIELEIANTAIYKLQMELEHAKNSINKSHKDHRQQGQEHVGHGNPYIINESESQSPSSKSTSTLLQCDSVPARGKTVKGAVNHTHHENVGLLGHDYLESLKREVKETMLKLQSDSVRSVTYCRLIIRFRVFRVFRVFSN